MMVALRNRIKLTYRLWVLAAVAYPKASWHQHLYLFSLGLVMPNFLLKAYINPQLRASDATARAAYLAIGAGR
jgi:hypothetical protein